MASCGTKKFDKNKKETLIKILAIGCSRATAARAARCSTRTILRHMQIDAEFAEEIRLAESAFQVKHRTHIEIASVEPKYWRASAWSLERKFPNEWGPRPPRMVTPVDAQRIFDQWVLILTDEVPDEALRVRLQARFGAVVDRFASESNLIAQSESSESPPDDLPEQYDEPCTD